VRQRQRDRERESSDIVFDVSIGTSGQKERDDLMAPAAAGFMEGGVSTLRVDQREREIWQTLF
jgi:hypothetical protein